ncbi:zinc finger protein 675-like isoform X1 [Ostrinia nubilalis]|uniref:zinc finger protein 675-like isoform X1 n=2 Tax=Ostrinia nubilalis TaxID=29057 RepID=UPI003082318B
MTTEMNVLNNDHCSNLKKQCQGGNIEDNSNYSLLNSVFEVPIEQADLCCCCLHLQSQKGLWQTYEWMGGCEKYGDMLGECFGLDLSDQINAKICEVCITQLRNAVCFKAQVSRCQARLREESDVKTHERRPDKQEKTENEVKVEYDYDRKDTTGHDDFFEDRPPSVKSENSSDEFSKTLKRRNDKSTPKNLKRLPIINKRKKGRKRLIQIKKDPKVDRRTVAFQSVKYTKPRRNVGLLLEHSTICPFKYSQAYFKCFYCSKNFLVFQELKNHVIDYHANISFIDIVKGITRPHDQVKVDVSEISCKICNLKCTKLDELTIHLSETHSVKFDENPEDSIISYDLGDNKFKCTVCKEEFLFFKTLAKHMNEHSSNHVCDVCGKCFLLIERLRVHVQMHSENAIKCDSCDKILPTKQALKSHIRYAHEKKLYACSICNEAFPTYRKRLQHFVEGHGRAPLSLQCDQCDKTFSSNSNLNHHVKYKHLMVHREAKYTCEDCGRKFKTKRVLTGHMLVHSGEKNFECEVCKKKFGRLSSLKEHLKIHRNDKRWSCGACAVCFVQKCSLKNHIRVHHAEYNVADLIVYKSPDK